MKVFYATLVMKLIQRKLRFKKYKKHRKILRIKQFIKNLKEIYFVPIDEDLIAKEIQNLNLKKLSQKMVYRSKC